jgi:predicted nucleic acid-binding protein
VLVVAPLRFQTPPRLIFEAWQDDRFELVLSEHILAEIARTHRKTYFQSRLSSREIADFQAVLREGATIVPIIAVPHGVATHPEDDLVLATSASGRESPRIKASRS